MVLVFCLIALDGFCTNRFICTRTSTMVSYNCSISDKPFIQHNLISKFRKIADLKFPVYVLHFPLLVQWRALFDYKINNRAQLWQAFVTVCIISAVIGIILEKQRFAWVHFFKWLVPLIRIKLLKIELYFSTSRNAI